MTKKEIRNIDVRDMEIEVREIIYSYSERERAYIPTSSLSFNYISFIT
jgi:hypothetical protein